MATKIKLSDIKDAAEKKYGIVSIELNEDGSEVADLTPALRLSKADRLKLEDINKPDADGKDADIQDVFEGWARIVAGPNAERLIELVGGRIDVWVGIQEEWAEKTQAGEA